MEVTQSLSASSILSLFQTTKEERQSFIASLVHEIREGYKNPMEVHLQVKCMEEIIEQLTSTDEKKNKSFEKAREYKKYLLEETIKLLGGAKATTFHNAKFEIKEVGTKYDFSVCNDPELVELQAAAESATAALKARQEWLKNAPASGTDIRVGDEMVTVFPPVKSSTTAVAISLK